MAKIMKTNKGFDVPPFTPVVGGPIKVDVTEEGGLLIEFDVMDPLDKYQVILTPGEMQDLTKVFDPTDLARGTFLEILARFVQKINTRTLWKADEIPGVLLGSADDLLKGLEGQLPFCPNFTPKDPGDPPNKLLHFPMGSSKDKEDPE